MNWEHAQSIANNFVAQWQSSAPGGGVVVFDEKSIRIQAFGGCASLEYGVPFTAESVVRMASITKHVTASLVLKCVDSGILNLDEPIGAYLPSVSDALGRVTVRGALDMTGGVPDMIDSAWMLGVPRTALLARDHVLNFLGSLTTLNFSPGDEFSYSNAGYRLVEAVLEARGIGLQTGIRQHLFEPLGVSATIPNDQSDVVVGLAPGYWWGPNGWRHGLSGMPYCGADALAVSTAQFAVWLQALLIGRGPAAGLMDRLATSAVLSNGRTTGVGLGIANSEIGGHAFHGFLGGLPGYRSSFLLSPSLKVGVLAVANREDADVGGLCVSLVSALLGVDARLPASTEILPDGMFVTADGPDWLELKQGYATFLGAQSFLYPTGDGNFDSNAFYSPMRLRQKGEGIIGEVGHRGRHFERILSSISPSPNWDGEWREKRHNGTFRVDVDGPAAHIAIGSGPAADYIKLIPLDERRAIFDRVEGPRRQRVCISFSSDGTSALLATLRSRVLRFERT